MVDADEFAITLNQAHVAVTLLVATYNAIILYARERLLDTKWPDFLHVHS